MLGHLLAALQARNVPVSAVLMDADGMPEKNANIFADRTAGRLPPIDPETLGDTTSLFYTVENHNDPEAISLVHELGLDVLFSQVTPRILKGGILDATPIGVVNVHPGLLPEYRGATCVEWAIYNDDPVGLTAHLMSAEIDAGPIIRRHRIDVSTDDTYTDIRVRVYRESVELQANVASDLWRGAIGPADFKPQGDGQYHRVIDDARLEEVLRKIENGEYAHMLAQADGKD